MDNVLEPQPAKSFASGWTSLKPLMPSAIPPGYEVITTSSRSMAQGCLRKYWYRNVLSIVPAVRDSSALFFGSAIHDSLELWHSGGTATDGGAPVRTIAWRLAEVEKHLNLAFPNRAENPHEKELWHYAMGMMRGYARRYPDDDFVVVAIEAPAWGWILNPVTNRKARRVVFALKCDAIVQKPDGTYWLMEHKTAGSVGGAYLDKLWADNQIVGYCQYLERYFGIQISGVIYNVLLKPKLKQSVGETEEAYQQRYEEACAASKSGKSSVKRKMPETDDEFQARLAEWFDRPEAFLREEILIDQSQQHEFTSELWNTVLLLKWCQKNNTWPRNRNNCFAYERKCGYHEVCGAQPCDEAWAIQNYAVHEEPHRELFGETAKPTF